MTRLLSLFKLAVVLSLLLCLGAVVAVAAAYGFLSPGLPSTSNLRDAQLQTPLRVYTNDGKLIAEFGEQRRTPIRLEETPEQTVQAFLAAEDERFFTHPGVDWQGLTRAVVHLVKTGEKGPGGSTITMQVARNFFLNREKTYVRKTKEILLAFKIEKELSKAEILELYLNKIFLGQRAYGVAAAAQVYYGKSLHDLTLEQVAMIAGLPKAPSRFNPVVNPERAVTRRNYVLSRMRELNFIDEQQYAHASSAPVTAKVHGLANESEAHYLAEMIRAEMEARFGDKAYTSGFRVFATVGSHLQEAANTALRNALITYDRRHGYRGPEAQFDVDVNDPAQIEKALADQRILGGLLPGIVTEVQSKSAVVVVRGGATVDLEWKGIVWAREYKDAYRRGPAPKKASQVLRPGDLVRVQLTEEEGWRLAQVPDIEGALVALDPEDGAVVALTGGFDFNKSKFNRVMQAERQPGSSFKPFIYSAALEKGYTPASFINDAPVVFNDVSLDDAWRPENYSGRFYGPTRLRVALYKSRNLVSIRLLQAIGIPYALKHLERFGWDAQALPPNLSLALGSGVVRPIEMARGYAVLANGGYLVEPYFIDRIKIGEELIYKTEPRRVCRNCGANQGIAKTRPISAGAVHRVSAAPVARREPSTSVGDAVMSLPGSAGSTSEVAPQTLPAPNAYIMASMMRDVVTRGTATRAKVLKRKDLAGKTGTTNDQKDAWFSGFTPGLVATAWVGFDEVATLGRKETGGRAALPMWIDFMRVALDGVPERFPKKPSDVVSVRIDPGSGRRLGRGSSGGVTELFRTDLERRGGRNNGRRFDPGLAGAPTGAGAKVTEKLF